MNTRHFLYSFIVILFLSCSQHARQKPTESKVYTPVSVQRTNGAQYVTLEFEKGKTSLTANSKKHLRDLAEAAEKSSRKVNDIKVLTWSDREYPTKATRASHNEIMLANDRARNIKNYLEEDLKTEAEIDFYNMAKRPTLMSRVFETDEYEVKDTFERVGTTKVKAADGRMAYTKASKALVIIDYEQRANK